MIEKCVPLHTEKYVCIFLEYVNSKNKKSIDRRGA